MCLSQREATLMRINLSTPLSDDKEMQRRNKAVLDAIERYTDERMAVDYVCEPADGSRSGGQPTVATQKAHTMVREVLAEWGVEPRSTTPAQLTIATTEALCRAIDQIEDLRVEAQAQFDRGYYDGCANPIVRYDALHEALERIEAATRNEVRAGDKGYISRYGINGIARTALEQNK